MQIGGGGGVGDVMENIHVIFFKYGPMVMRRCCLKIFHHFFLSLVAILFIEKPVLWNNRVKCILNLDQWFIRDVSSNGCHSGLKIFKPEKNLEFFRLKNFEARDDYPGRLE